jgi:hypothetical protein
MKHFKGVAKYKSLETSVMYTTITDGNSDFSETEQWESN